MDFKTLELAASRKEPIDQQLNLVDQMCFLALRSLYADWMAGRIEKEQAKRERKILKNAYDLALEKLRKQEAMYRQYQYGIKVIAGHLSDLVNGAQGNMTETALLLLAVDCLGGLLGEDVTAQTVRRAIACRMNK